MILGIMQPYFFPYLGYFSLMKHTDAWVVFDVVQYIDRGWVNRNRIIHPTKPEASYISVPVKDVHRDTKIQDVQIDASQPYAERILGQLTASYKKRAPYFRKVTELVQDCLSSETANLSRLNTLSMERVCDYLGIPLELSVFSQMELAIDPVHAPDEWALNISKAMGAEIYRNPPGAMELFDGKKYADGGVKLEFLKQNFTEYSQKKSVFLEGLSILDAMMFCSPEEINGMLDDFTLLPPRE